MRFKAPVEWDFRRHWIATYAYGYAGMPDLSRWATGLNDSDCPRFGLVSDAHEDQVEEELDRDRRRGVELGADRLGRPRRRRHPQRSRQPRRRPPAPSSSPCCLSLTGAGRGAAPFGTRLAVARFYGGAAARRRACMLPGRGRRAAFFRAAALPAALFCTVSERSQRYAAPCHEG